MKVADFDYALPAAFIAQAPADPRDSAKLLHLERATGAIRHLVFRDIADLLERGDLLLLNDTRVLPARLRARKAETGGAVEILLLRRTAARRWQALVGGRNIRPGMRLQIKGTDATCLVVDEGEKSQRTLEFDRPLSPLLADYGEMPLPPYIRAYTGERERYQTVYAKEEGSAAAPTAGLHFTPKLLRRLERKGVQLATCTLHIGLDTFQPVTAERVEDHKIHSEFARLDGENARLINEAKASGGRVIAVGTTAARTLETAAIVSAGGHPGQPDTLDDFGREPRLRAFGGDTELFITPGYRWRGLDGIITNFHLPRSTLLMMISAFVGRDRLLAAYEAAKSQGYRFYSFGDAMFIA